MNAHVRGSLIALAAAGQIDPDTRRQWIEVMPTAEKARNGRWYFTVDRDDLETYAAYIGENAERILVDRDHEGADGGSTKAAGWFTGATRIIDDPDRGPILTAEVEWTPTAVQEIEDGEFRFISPEFGFEERDKKSGLLTKAKDFIAATLTNRPFFSQLAALAAADGTVLWDADVGVNQLQADLAEALNPGASNYDSIRYWVCDVDPVGQRMLVSEAGPGDDAWIVPYSRDSDGNLTIPPSSDWIPVEQAWVADTDDPRASAVITLDRRKTGQLLAAALAAKNTGGASAATTQEDHVSDTLKALAADLGLPEDATDEQITQAVTAIKQTADRVPELEQQLETAKAAQARGAIVDPDALAQLQTDAALGREAREEQIAAARAQLVDERIRGGFITAASRDAHLAELAKGGEIEKAHREYLNGLTAVIVPVEDRVIATGDTQAASQLNTVRAHLGLAKAAS